LDQKSTDLLRAEFAAEPMRRRYGDVPNQEARDFDDILRWLLKQLRNAAIGTPAMVDLSKPGIPAAVVRVVVPGLEGSSDAPGYKPGARALAPVVDGEVK